MKLDFRLLVIDDQPGEIGDAIEMLRMELEDKGFRLEVEVAQDISAKGIDDYCKADGRNIDLAIVDYKLGEGEFDGALAASTVRRRLKYTDIIFYSTSPRKELAQRMAEHHVDGVFIASRGDDFDEVLRGVADTIVGKAVDLNHMRGIAIAEAAEMDLLMEEILAKAFASKNDAFVAKGKDRIESLLANERDNILNLERRIERSDVVGIVTDNAIFGSTYKWQAVSKLGEMALGKGDAACTIFADYEAQVIAKRNLLAHARAIMDDGNTASLRAIRPGKPDVEIDDTWMVEFRGQLNTQRNALRRICEAIHDRCPA
ncbi:response regulator [Sphingomonas sp. ACRSK]|uniref:response regulator n=1 Tax=Sphingomonas sp. ACRSK TaxID=2918213 RepID=UPI001EF43ADD|nr:response regulator [Sphingomonas sp. ACRSK]MCG7349445.1 response regulator [Sphingomonas sp. ACRSK]